MSISIKRTAYHEAGHAVMASILRLRCKEISIIPDEDYLGRFIRGAVRNIDPECESNQKTRSELERLTMQVLAGNVAEHLLTGRKCRVGSGDDYHKAVNYLSYVASDEEIPHYLEALWYRTKAKLSVDHQWLAVQRLAEELLKKRRLKSKRIKEIIRQAIDEDFKRKMRQLKSTGG